ncbi:MAG: hypothetical protein WBD66_02250, partial [Candidatus Acidiferrales bacterium]
MFPRNFHFKRSLTAVRSGSQKVRRRNPRLRFRPGRLHPGTNNFHVAATAIEQFRARWHRASRSRALIVAVAEITAPSGP